MYAETPINFSNVVGISASAYTVEAPNDWLIDGESDSEGETTASSRVTALIPSIRRNAGVSSTVSDWQVVRGLHGSDDRPVRNEPSPGVFERANDARIQLLARRFASKSLSPEESARLWVETNRVRRIFPRVTDEHRAALRELETEVTRARANLAALRAGPKT
jgi:hypothetical protein